MKIGASSRGRGEVGIFYQLIVALPQTRLPPPISEVVLQGTGRGVTAYSINSLSLDRMDTTKGRFRCGFQCGARRERSEGQGSG